MIFSPSSWPLHSMMFDRAFGERPVTRPLGPIFDSRHFASIRREVRFGTFMIRHLALSCGFFNHQDNCNSQEKKLWFLLGLRFFSQQALFMLEALCQEVV